MVKENELVINSSYKDFFLNPDTMRKDSFIIPEINELYDLENSHLTRSLALFLKNIDEDPSVIYGIEIKSNGSERSSRIPLVRFSKDITSICKIASGIKSLEKSVTVLNDLFYFLKEHSNGYYELPQKILILKEDESLYSKENSPYKSFVENIIVKNDIKLISFDFLIFYIKNNKKINFKMLLSDNNIITTANL